MTNRNMSLVDRAQSRLRRYMNIGYSHMMDRSHVTVAGWEASGSTFIFQACKLLGLSVKKIHGLPSDNYGYILFPFRDPRDIITSNAKRVQGKLWVSDPESALLLESQRFVEDKFADSILRAKKKSSVLLIRYELFFNSNERSLIALIADQFSITIDDHEIDNIYDSISLEANQARASSFTWFGELDKDWQIHGNHISNQGRSGGWQQHFTEKVKVYVKQNIGDLLIDLRYTNGYDW